MSSEFSSSSSSSLSDVQKEHRRIWMENWNANKGEMIGQQLKDLKIVYEGGKFKFKTSSGQFRNRVTGRMFVTVRSGHVGPAGDFVFGEDVRDGDADKFRSTDLKKAKYFIQVQNVNKKMLRYLGVPSIGWDENFHEIERLCDEALRFKNVALKKKQKGSDPKWSSPIKENTNFCKFTGHIFVEGKTYLETMRENQSKQKQKTGPTKSTVDHFIKNFKDLPDTIPKKILNEIKDTMKKYSRKELWYKDLPMRDSTGAPIPHKYRNFGYDKEFFAPDIFLIGVSLAPCLDLDRSMPYLGINSFFESLDLVLRADPKMREALGGSLDVRKAPTLIGGNTFKPLTKAELKELEDNKTKSVVRTDEDDEMDDKEKKKSADKLKFKPRSKKGDSDDEGEKVGSDDEDKPKSKSKSKKHGSEDEEDEPKSKSKSKSKKHGSEDEEDEPKSKSKSKSKKHGSEDEEDEPKSKSKSKSKKSEEDEDSEVENKSKPKKSSHDSEDEDKDEGKNKKKRKNASEDEEEEPNKKKHHKSSDNEEEESTLSKSKKNKDEDEQEDIDTTESSKKEEEVDEGQDKDNTDETASQVGEKD